jgi:cytidyltransferase-like protein
MSEKNALTHHASRIMRLGILGGTFDPPHFGHLRLAEAALTQLQLDQVLFAPVGVQPLKRDHPATAPEHRARMVEPGHCRRSALRLITRRSRSARAALHRRSSCYHSAAVSRRSVVVHHG